MPTAPASTPAEAVDRPTTTALPVARLTAIAAMAPPAAVAAYHPTEKDVALAGALFTSKVTTFEDLAAAAGISLSTLERIREEPARAAWIVSRASDLAQLGRAAVYARVFERALASKSPQWAKLFLELFDDGYKKQQAAAAPTTNTQFNFIGSMSDRELRAFIDQMQRRVLGSRE